MFLIFKSSDRIPFFFFGPSFYIIIKIKYHLRLGKYVITQGI